MLENFRKMSIQLTNANEAFYQKLVAKEGDVNGRELEVKLINNGVVENLENVHLRLNWKNLAVGNSGMHDFSAVDRTKGLFKITYPESMLNKGNVTAYVSILQSRNIITNTRNFTILVEGSGLDAQTVIASDDFQALNDALIQVNRYQIEIDSIKADIIADADSLIATERNRIQDILKGIEPRIDGLESQFNDAMSEVTSDTEIIASRSSTTTGKNYTTVGERINDVETRQLANNLDTKEKFIVSMEVKSGQPRLRMEEI